MTSFPISSISNAFNAAKGRFIPSNSRMGSSLPSNLTTKFPLPGFSLLITTSTAAPCCARYFCILPARVLNTDHCLHASIERTLPPVAAATAAADAFLGDAFFAAGDFFALVASAFVAFLALDVPLVFAMVQEVIEICCVDALPRSDCTKMNKS